MPFFEKFAPPLTQSQVRHWIMFVIDRQCESKNNKIKNKRIPATDLGRTTNLICPNSSSVKTLILF